MIIAKEKAVAEWWLLSNKGNHLTLHNSNINHYEQVYPREKYAYAYA